VKLDSRDGRIAMAEDTMTEAVVISAVVANALRNAGLLKEDAKQKPSPPNPPLSVGAQVSIFPVVAVAKTFETQPKDVTRFTLTESRRGDVRIDETAGDYDLHFRLTTSGTYLSWNDCSRLRSPAGAFTRGPTWR
jgi:hypothetical protein